SRPGGLRQSETAADSVTLPSCLATPAQKALEAFPPKEILWMENLAKKIRPTKNLQQSPHPIRLARQLGAAPLRLTAFAAMCFRSVPPRNAAALQISGSCSRIPRLTTTCGFCLLRLLCRKS